MQEHTDEALMMAFHHGDDRAFDVLFQRHGTAVKAYALRMLRSPQEAEDVLVDAFVRIAQARGRWEEKGTFRGFAYRTAHNLCMDVLRQRHRHRQALDQTSFGKEALLLQPSPEAEAILGQTAVILEAALAQLPEPHRGVVLLRLVHGLSGEEVAQVMGVEESQVRSQLSYARKQLRTHLERSESRRTELRAAGEERP